MIYAQAATTDNIDDVDAAVSDILDGLKLNELKRNTVGIISCYAEFIHSGALQAIAAALPFQTVGITTLSSANSSGGGDMALNITVLTSNDVLMQAGLSEPVLSDDGAVLTATYKNALSKLPGKPSLMFSYVPLLMNLAGDWFSEVFNTASGGVPNFGVVTVDHKEDYSESAVLFNGKAYNDRCAIVLLYGEVKCHFGIATLSPEKIMLDKGIITASKDCQLQTVNDLPAKYYLESIGVQESGLNSFPFVLDFNDGSEPAIRGIFALTPENAVVCGGHMPVGSTLSIGAVDAEDIFKTTEETATLTAKTTDAAVILCYSCIGRYLYLGLDTSKETDVVASIMSTAGLPFMFTYGGGEICPVYLPDGSMVNRAHNITCVFCAIW
jgi:hypothetical protein